MCNLGHFDAYYKANIDSLVLVIRLFRPELHNLLKFNSPGLSLLGNKDFKWLPWWRKSIKIQFLLVKWILRLKIILSKIEVCIQYKRFLSLVTYVCNNKEFNQLNSNATSFDVINQKYMTSHNFDVIIDKDKNNNKWVLDRFCLNWYENGLTEMIMIGLKYFSKILDY